MRTLLIVCSLWSGSALVLGQNVMPAAIEDNSFIIEEAYNQEHRVVQHISTIVHSRHSKDWTYAFSQEWPMIGQTHQISYTIPYSYVAGRHVHGLGDIAINYRYEAINKENGLAMAPRVSVILPTGNEDKSLGTGRATYQINLPVSKRPFEHWAFHFNAGIGMTPGVKVGLRKRTLWTHHIGASAIALLHPRFNVMVEWLTLFEDEVSNGKTNNLVTTLLNPGIRWAHNFGQLQVVPGFSVPIEVNQKYRTQLFGYLSLEHPF